MGLAERSSRPHSAVLCLAQRIRRAWIVSTSLRECKHVSSRYVCAISCKLYAYTLIRWLSFQHPEVYGSELDGDDDDDELDPTDNTDKPTETTTSEAHSSRSDARLSSSSSSPVENSPDASFSSDAPAPPTRTAKNDPAAGASRDDKIATPKRDA